MRDQIRVIGPRDHEAIDMSLDEVVNNPHMKMGHAFVLKMMLGGR